MNDISFPDDYYENGGRLLTSLKNIIIISDTTVCYSRPILNSHMVGWIHTHT